MVVDVAADAAVEVVVGTIALLVQIISDRGVAVQSAADDSNVMVAIDQKQEKKYI